MKTKVDNNTKAAMQSTIDQLGEQVGRRNDDIVELRAELRDCKRKCETLQAQVAERLQE